ncbi:MAG: hypothetical protein ACHP9Z_26690 [Streptosporangiales bacterium]
MDWVVALASSQMADERQSAVLGQVSSATLSLMIGLTYAAGLAFTLIDYRRLEPCVWVFLAIALGAQAFTRAAARRQGVDFRTRIKAESWGGIVFSSIAFGTIFVALKRFVPGLGGGSWRDDVQAGAVATLLWAVLLKRRQKQKQKAVLLAEGTVADAPDAPLDA